MGLAVGIILATIGGILIAELMRRRLARLDYRLGGEAMSDRTGASGATALPEVSGDTKSDDDVIDETRLPSPGPRRWMLVVLGLTWAGILWALCAEGTPQDLTQWARLVTWLAFSAVGLWLAVIDLDVQRLPDRAQVVLALAMLMGGVLTAWNEPLRWAVGLGVALACGAAFLLVHVISRGGLGLGDVKLVMTCGWWLALTSPVAVVAAVAAACVLGLIYCLVIRSRQFAFGPWLIAGSLLAGLTG
ncbi:MAG: A24 family peptidase [Propionibacteriaceae bacterium]|jgi:leader peptidase (prepilin peptidase)/N-methyltransferase|nr:A24 family peptidase [Propionibacteriaceae bacterium]